LLFSFHGWGTGSSKMMGFGCDLPGCHGEFWSRKEETHSTKWRSMSALAEGRRRLARSPRGQVTQLETHRGFASMTDSHHPHNENLLVANSSPEWSSLHRANCLSGLTKKATPRWSSWQDEDSQEKNF
jgi:hypothetical protein